MGKVKREGGRGQVGESRAEEEKVWNEKNKHHTTPMHYRLPRLGPQHWVGHGLKIRLLWT